MGCGASKQLPNQAHEGRQQDAFPELSKSPPPELADAERRRGSFVSPEHVPEKPRAQDEPETNVPWRSSKRIGTLSSHGLKPGRDGRASDKINQDRGLITYPFNDDKQAALFCVYDGHGVYGELVSEFVMWRVQETLLAAPGRIYSDTEALLTQAFEEADQQLKKSSIDSLASGSTAAAVLALKDILVRGFFFRSFLISQHTYLLLQLFANEWRAL